MEAEIRRGPETLFSSKVEGGESPKYRNTCMFKLKNCLGWFFGGSSPMFFFLYVRVMAGREVDVQRNISLQFSLLRSIFSFSSSVRKDFSLVVTV